MKKLINDLKTAFNGLAYADLGEMCTDEQKTHSLGGLPEATPLQKRMAANSTGAASRHIVLAINGRLQSAAILYAISTCRRMDARLVVLGTGTHAETEQALAPHLAALTEAELSYRIVTQSGTLQEAVAKHHRYESGILLAIDGSGHEVSKASARTVRTRHSAWRLDFPLIVVSDMA